MIIPCKSECIVYLCIIGKIFIILFFGQTLAINKYVANDYKSTQYLLIEYKFWQIYN